MMGENSSRIANKLIEAKANMATTNVARRAIACLIDLGFMRTIHTNNAGAMPRTSVWNHNVDFHAKLSRDFHPKLSHPVVG